MPVRSWIIAGSLLAGAAWAARAQPPAFPTDPEIVKMVADVSVSRIQRTILVLASSTTRHTLSDSQPSGDGIGGAGAWIQAELERVSQAAGGRLKVESPEFAAAAAPPLLPHATTLVDFTATLPGSRPEAANRVYVVLAHYDSRGRDPMDAQAPAPGADDDASGVAAVIAAARALAPYDFGATIVFLVASGGEQGALGAAHWAEDAHRRGLVIAGVIDADEIGNTATGGGEHSRGELRVFAGADPEAPSRGLAAAVRAAAAAYVPDLRARLVARADRFGEVGGHRPFLERGDPAVRLTEAADDPGAHPDTTDFIDYAYVTEAARVAVAAVATLARAPAAPTGAQAAVGERGKPTVVSWKPASDPAVAGYRVVWRDTMAPDWTGWRDLPASATTASLPGLAPEDFVFGVQAWDAAGHASPVAVARIVP